MRKLALIALATILGLASAASFAGDEYGAAKPAATMKKHHKKHHHHHHHHHKKMKKAAGSGAM